MNQINTDNYEAFFLDFVEGRLDDSSTLALLSFLKTHPELKNELETFEDMRLLAPLQEYSGKAALKKMDFSIFVNHENFAERCIAFHENLLNEQARAELSRFLEIHPDLKRDFELFGSSRLVADQRITYENKSELKHFRLGIKTAAILKWSGVAAGLILAVSFYFTGRQHGQPHDTDLSQSNSLKFQSGMGVPSKPAKKIISYAKAVHPPVSREINNKSESVNQTDTFHIEPDAPVYLDSRNKFQLASTPESRPAFDINPSVYHESQQDEPELLGYAENLLEQNFKKFGDVDNLKKKVNFWNLAKLTLKGFNRLTENDIKLYTETDENGKVTALAIETPNHKYGFSNKN